VHDSYWCHSSTADLLSETLRAQFIKLHSEPLITNLNENFTTRYPHEKFPEMPVPGTFDLNEVKQSPYFFS
jgi:DNA-directed RNA polymerase